MRQMRQMRQMGQIGQMHVWLEPGKKYAFLIAHMRAEEFPKPAQPSPRFERTRASRQLAQFSMFGKKARDGLGVDLLSGELQQPFLFGEVLRHALAPVIFDPRDSIHPDSAVIHGGRSLGITCHD